MKKMILMIGLVLGFTACNDDTTTSETNTNSDSVDHGAHHQSTATTDSAGRKDMMGLMHGMMEDMKDIRSTGDPDNDFAALMKAHHLGAIEMAELEVATGTDEQIKKMAQKMIDDQQREVSAFDNFLSSNKAEGGNDAFFTEAMAAMNNMKMDMDHSGTVDKQFVEMMIPHHQSAVDMSRVYLKSGTNKELKNLANNIISSQQKEIRELQGWLAKNR